MSSLNIALTTATSGLMAAQTGLSTVSDNISNVNTPGYVRKQVNQQQLSVNGVGQGVEVTDITRVTDQYLQLASLSASADSGKWDVYSQYLDNAQSLFGDPSSSSSFFNSIDNVYAGFASAANDPSNNLLRSQAVSNVQDFLSQASQINGQLTQLTSTVDTRVGADVDQVNSLLSQISQLNASISRSRLTNADASGAENIQSQLLDQLSGLISVKIAQRANGGVDVRSPEGVLLAGDQAATLTYNASATTPGYISATPAGGGSSAQPIQVNSGEIRGLLDLRNTGLPGLSDQLGEFVTQAVQQLNQAHNNSSAVPAPATLTGRSTGLDLPTAVSGFTGQTTIAIVDPTGVVQHTIAIDFTAQTMSVDGGAATATSPATFLADLNTALGANGSASYSASGQLSISATGGNGIAIDQPSTNGSAKWAAQPNAVPPVDQGPSFSAFFGLNDLVQSTGYANYQTGLQGTNTDGFGGQSITFQVSQPDGKPLRQVTVNLPVGDMNAMQTALNSAASGLGVYGSFNLDPTGTLAFTGAPPTNANISVVQDNTSWNGSGPSFSQLFGVGLAQRSTRASSYQVNPAIVSDPTQLALAKLDLTVPAGTSALRPGDGTGAQAIANSGANTTTFYAAGTLGQVDVTVQRYASEFGGAVGREAQSASTQQQSADAIKTEATNRRSAVESVNLDEELVHLQTYQQAYNASARMIQATSDLFNTLMTMVSGL
ncbi:MAG: flagellar hook-associated protein FlgK [Alphaproteobacteria bacterium]|nr:flagellar hook-associated protein FlgK [Alphaproteobacteria bacterium]